MSEMVERVARAIGRAGGAMCIYPHLDADVESNWEWISDKLHHGYLLAARAAIEAMREPTADVISAGDASLPFSRGTETHRMAGGITPEGIWDAMIEAALCDHDWQENTEEEDCCSKCEATRES